MASDAPKIKDVAARAGVSTATVSRVLSGADYTVSDELRDKVMRAAEALSYTPNVIGRAFRTGKTDTLGVMIPGITSSHHAVLVAGIEEICNREGYIVVVASSFRDKRRELEILRQFRVQQINSIIIASFYGDISTLAELEREGVSVALIDEARDGLGCPCITVDLYNAIREAVGYLAGKGHRKIGYVSTPLIKATRKSELDGFMQGMAEAALQPDMTYLYTPRSESEHGQNYEYSLGERYAHRLLGLSDPPSAVVASNDMIAIGCMKTLARAGWRIPNDISFVGVEDIPLASLTDPALTTMRVPAVRIGHMAARSVLKHTPGEQGRHHTIKPNLVERDSVAEYGAAPVERARAVPYSAPNDLRMAKF